MIEEIEAFIINDLHSNKPCIPSYYAQRFPRIQANQLLKIFIGIFTRDAGVRYDLLCHIVIHSHNKMHAQNQRYSNVQKGIIVAPNGSSLQFNKIQLKQLKILAIFPNFMNNLAVQESIQQFSNAKKSKHYQNRSTILPKLIVENKNNNNKSKNKKDQKPKQEVKVQIQEQKKNLKKTNSKSSIEVQPSKPQGLKKVSSKDQTPQPILTNYQAERKKVQEKIIQKPKASLKMQLDSDQDYYNPQKPEQLQVLINPKQVDTDMSGKKQKEQKMEIEVQRQKSENPKDKFIVNDDEDDEEDEIFNKMEEIQKKPSVTKSQSSQSLNNPKTETTTKPIQKKDAPKQPLGTKQIPQNKPVVQTKQGQSLLCWFKPKQAS